jgi:broad specificity phosphatase PhoE
MRVARVLTLLAFGLLAPLHAIGAERATTILLVRHAEKAAAGGSDPSLSEAGKARALALAHVAGSAGVTAVFHTELQRTRLTVAPLATALGLTPIEHPARDTAGLVNDILTNWRGKTVLVSGHSNTVPEIVKALTRTQMADIPDSEYDNLYVVVLPSRGAAGVTQLKYGERTP